MGRNGRAAIPIVGLRPCGCGSRGRGEPRHDARDRRAGQAGAASPARARALDCRAWFWEHQGPRGSGLEAIALGQQHDRLLRHHLGAAAPALIDRGVPAIAAHLALLDAADLLSNLALAWSGALLVPLVSRTAAGLGRGRQR